MGPLEAGAKNVLQPKVVLFSSIKTLPDYSNPRVLHQKYVVEGLSLNEVAKLIGSSKTAVLENLRRHNIPLRPAHQPHGRNSNPPYGYHRVKSRVVPHPKEQKMIQAIKKMYLEKGLAMSAIVKALTRDDVPTKTGKGPWRHEMVRLILKREKLL